MIDGSTGSPYGRMSMHVSFDTSRYLLARGLDMWVPWEFSILLLVGTVPTLSSVWDPTLPQCLVTSVKSVCREWTLRDNSSDEYVDGSTILPRLSLLLCSEWHLLELPFRLVSVAMMLLCCRGDGIELLWYLKVRPGELYVPPILPSVTFDVVLDSECRGFLELKKGKKVID